MFWRIELDKEGNIHTCDPCEDKGKNGGRIIFIEAETKVDACNRAKQWHAHKKDYMKTLARERRENRIRDGLCTSCGRRRPREGRRTCTVCANDQSARDRGGVDARELLSPDEAYRRQQEQSESWRKRRGGSRASTLRTVLRQFDTLGPDEFRFWLIAEIVRIDSEFRDAAPAVALVAVR